MKRSRVSRVRRGGDPRRSRSPGNPPAPARGTHGTGLRRAYLEASCHGNARADLERGGSKSRDRGLEWWVVFPSGSGARASAVSRRGQAGGYCLATSARLVAAA